MTASFEHELDQPEWRIGLLARPLDGHGDCVAMLDVHHALHYPIAPRNVAPSLRPRAHP
jgi:hypothetical protein